MAIERNILASNFKSLTLLQFYEFLAQTWLGESWEYIFYENHC